MKGFAPRLATDADDLRTFTPALWEGQPVPSRHWLIDGLIATEDERALIQRILADRRNLLDRFNF